jgi:hypothetical protein
MIPGIMAVLPVFISGEVEGKDDGPAIAEGLTRLEHQFAEATMNGDDAGVADLLAPEFTGVNPGGKEFTRAEVLANLHSPDRKVEFLRHENLRVKIFGGCAVVFAVTVTGWESGNETVTGRFPYMRVWVKRGGRWLAVATQSCGSEK